MIFKQVFSTLFFYHKVNKVHTVHIFDKLVE